MLSEDVLREAKHIRSRSIPIINTAVASHADLNAESALKANSEFLTAKAVRNDSKEG